MQKYEIIRELGCGSFGKVILAQSKRTREKVAIKEIPLSHLQPEQREKALQEAQLLSSLKHPNIVCLKDSFQSNGNLYIVMEYVDGGDLSQKINERSSHPFSEVEILRIFIQIAFALEYVHQKKIIHRDIKPQNIFLTRVGVAKLGDFGVARELDNSDEMAQTVIGTPYYLSPEIWNGEPYNTQTDIWSLGCILYELCALKRPFSGRNAQQLFANVIRGQMDPIPSNYSADIRALIQSMLSPDPSTRPSCTQILQLPFIQAGKKAMVVENEAKLKTVNIVVAKVETNAFVKKRRSPPQMDRKVHANRLVKLNSKPDLEDLSDELPLPNEEAPKWALRPHGAPKSQRVVIQDEVEQQPTEWDELKEVTERLQSSSEEKSIDEIKAEIEGLKQKLLKINGADLVDYLRFNIENEEKEVCAQFVSIISETDPDSVENMRELISLEKKVAPNKDS